MVRHSYLRGFNLSYKRAILCEHYPVPNGWRRKVTNSFFILNTSVTIQFAITYLHKMRFYAGGKRT